MILIADTNLLVRIVTDDDKAQRATALEALKMADAVAIPTLVLCELCWVLRASYRRKAHDIAGDVRAIIDRDGVLLDRPSVDAGLRLLDQGGDFADGVIAHEGERLGGDRFVSFDGDAVELLSAAGITAQRLQ